MKSIKSKYGSVSLGDTTVDMVSEQSVRGLLRGTGLRWKGSDLTGMGLLVIQALGGMRGIKGMLWETSLLDPDEVRISSVCPLPDRRHSQTAPQLWRVSGYPIPGHVHT